MLRHSHKALSSCTPVILFMGKGFQLLASSKSKPHFRLSLYLKTQLKALGGEKREAFLSVNVTQLAADPIQYVHAVHSEPWHSLSQSFSTNQTKYSGASTLGQVQVLPVPDASSMHIQQQQSPLAGHVAFKVLNNQQDDNQVCTCQLHICLHQETTLSIRRFSDDTLSYSLSLLDSSWLVTLKQTKPIMHSLLDGSEKKTKPLSVPADSAITDKAGQSHCARWFSDRTNVSVDRDSGLVSLHASWFSSKRLSHT